MNLTHLNYATIILDFSAVILVFGILCETRLMRRSGRKADQLFFRMLILTAIMAVSDTVAYITENNSQLKYAQFISMTIFYIAFTLLSMYWFGYCTFKFRNAQIDDPSGIYAPYIPGIISILVIFLNIFAHFVFYVDDLGGYHRSFLFIPMYLILIGYIAVGFFFIERYRTVDKKQLIPLWLYILPIVVGIIVTFIVGEVSMAALGTAITIAFTHLGTMNEVAEISLREIK